MRATPPIEQIVQTIVAHVHPRRVVLFGSFARGDATEESDVDLMVEMDAGLDYRACQEAIDALFPRRPWGMDVLVYTPADVEARRDDPGTMVYAIEREGKVLYRRPELDTPANTTTVRERPSEPVSVDWWVRAAQADIEVIELILAAGATTWNHVAFLAQQAAEKYLKALLIARWQRPDRTHNLLTILDACRANGFALVGLDDDCRTLASHAVKPRYPDDFLAPPRAVTEDEARAAVAAMRRIVASARETLDASS